ncbi:MAG TPA: hypothetical protein VJM31_16385 [Vicinamibacterales bacterium]|nr:hypothetical protein [Vicinamibacterales bacterium]
MGGVLGKRVFYDGLERVIGEMACPRTRAEILEALRARDIAVAEEDDWIFLFPGALGRPDGTLPAHIRWKRLSIVPMIENWHGVPNSRRLTASEQNLILAKVLDDARPAPLVTPSVARLDGDAVRVEYLVRVLAVSLKSGRESIVAILGEDGGANRVVYGVLERETFTTRWDSPLFKGNKLHLGFQDVDGDGQSEILLQASYGLNQDGRMVFILDANGEELTRELPCVTDTYQASAASGLCPIAAGDFVLDDPREGKRDLIIRHRHQDIGSDGYEKTHRYTLRNGRYVHAGVLRR